MKDLIPIISIALLTTGCASLDKMIDQGNFDAAIQKSIKKISGKRKLKQKHVVAIEEAFHKANNQDISDAKRLFESAQSVDWEKSIAIYDRMLRRQRSLQPLLPIVSKNGHHAKFNFVRVDPLRRAAVEKFLTLIYDEVQQYMSQARQGKKLAARKAWTALNKLTAYDHDYADIFTLRREARELGTTHVFVSLLNRMRMPLRESDKRMLLQESFTDRKWIEYHFNNNTGATPDLEMTITLEAIEFTPERFVEQLYQDQKEIEVGFDYVLDERGNVKKDSAGNDIKVPKLQMVYADVVKSHQYKAAMIEGYLKVKDVLVGHVDHFPIQSNIVFEHFGATYRGDERALSPDTKKLLRTSVVPFPSDRVMMRDALLGLDDVIKKDVLRRLPI